MARASSPSPQRLKGLATRQRILDAAVELFADRPFENVQVFEIAERADVAHGLIFHHFTNKRGIYLEAVHEISRRLFALPVRDPGLAPYEHIRRLIRDHFQHMADNEALLLGYIRGSIALMADSEASAVLEGHRAELGTWALELFGFDPASRALRMMMRVATSGMDDISLQWLQNDKPWAIADQLVEATVELMIGSFRAAARLDPTLDLEPGIRRIEKPRSKKAPRAHAPRPTTPGDCPSQ